MCHQWTESTLMMLFFLYCVGLYGIESCGVYGETNMR